MVNRRIVSNVLYFYAFVYKWKNAKSWKDAEKRYFNFVDFVDKEKKNGKSKNSMGCWLCHSRYDAIDMYKSEKRF